MLRNIAGNVSVATKLHEDEQMSAGFVNLMNFDDTLVMNGRQRFELPGKIYLLRRLVYFGDVDHLHRDGLHRRKMCFRFAPLPELTFCSSSCLEASKDHTEGALSDLFFDCEAALLKEH